MVVVYRYNSIMLSQKQMNEADHADSHNPYVTARQAALSSCHSLHLKDTIF
jgi:hypothetical protein